ncbi:ribbon-helix-helix domain-containing protein [Acidisoma sp. 7E03]
MDVTLTPDQERLIAEAVATGRFRRREDAVQEALKLWEAQENARLRFLQSLDRAEASIAEGGGLPVTEVSMRELADSVIRRGRERLGAKEPRRR